MCSEKWLEKKEAGGAVSPLLSVPRIRDPLLVLEVALAAAAAMARVAVRCGCVWCSSCWGLWLLDPTPEFGDEELVVGDSSE